MHSFVSRIGWKLVSSVALLVAFTSPAGAATSDSFFDVWVGLADDPILLDSTGVTTYPSVSTEMVSLSLRSSAPTQVVSDPGDGSFVVDSFFDVFYSAGPNGGPYDSDSFFDITVRMEFLPTGSTADSRDWDTEMLSMDLRSTAPSGGSTTRPALSSTAGRHRGHVTVLKLAGGGGATGGTDRFQIDSFFDIHTEISLDGGGSYAAADGPTPLSFNTIVPEPSTATLLACGLAVLGARRRR